MELVPACASLSVARRKKLNERSAYKNQVLCAVAFLNDCFDMKRCPLKWFLIVSRATKTQN